MSTDEFRIIDVAAVLAPISDDSPAGESLKYTDPYNRIEEARRAADKAENDGDDYADWPTVIDLAVEALSSQSKDLTIGAWLTDALVRNHGYRGFVDGLRVMNGFLRDYWDTVYPRVDDGDFDARLAPLIWLTASDRGSRLVNRLRELPMTPPSESGKVFSWRLWTSPVKPAADSSSDDEPVEDDRTLFRKALNSARREFYIQLVDDISAAVELLREFDSLMDRNFGDQAPATGALRESLAACETLARQFLAEKGGLPAGSGSDSADADSSAADVASSSYSADSSSGGSRSGGPIRNREDALRRLEEAAEFLRTTEPQSPVPYLIERAVTWGRMPFHELLNELLSDDAVRGHVRGLLGIRSE